ncbi:carotenoid 1,2-hydratase [Vibrio sp. S11_S32]|uniref:lipocalin-like domain-containing protein n=1 Tax=Vibrio sp. S11_S32 TaxID=2720225 RepID=UPI00168060C0|nr:lipocalin-like domain-containing protein [Vibrio sp. S11_S32]MBD1577315.1 carotenoid 1,2-hydratase [Vibrio sp. S11_S32]
MKHNKCLGLKPIFIAVMVLCALILMPSLFKNFLTKTPESVEVTPLHYDKFVYEPVLPGKAVSIVKDMNEHTAFHYETWHYRANVKGSDGKDYGVQWLMYRIANSDNTGVGWKNAQIYTTQVVVSTAGKSWAQQRIARGGVGQAGVLMDPFRLWIDNWSWQSSNNTAAPSRIMVHSDDFSVDLRTASFGPYVLMGDKGYKVTHDLLSKASYQFSAPFLRTKGKLVLNGKTVEVQGLAWIDKEWGNDLVPEKGFAWDAFSIHLTDGRTLALNQYHQQDQMKYVTGTLAARNGSVINIDNDDIRLYPLEKVTLLDGRVLPLRWVIEIPKYDISLITQTMKKELWLPFWIPSWEGPIRVTGSQMGVGFMQLTYD